MTDNRSQSNPQPSSGPSRREFLTRAGLMAGGLAFLGLSGMKPTPAGAVVDSRALTSSTSALELDGIFVDTLKSAEGGFPRGEVITEPAGPTLLVKKHVGQIKFQDIAIQCDPVIPKPLFDWVAASLTMNYARKNGAIITADFNGTEQSRLQFTNALLTEFTVPTLDGASKDVAYVTIKFAPEMTTISGGKGGKAPSLAAKTKAALASNFRLTIPGLDCSRVSKIDALTIKQTIQQDTIGQARDYAKQPGKLEFPNLTLYVAEAYAGTFYAWFQDMVLKGNSGEQNERAGVLELLDPTLKNSVLTLYLNHLGIFGYTPDKTDAGVEKVRTVKVEMYCEQITLTPVKG